MGRNDKYDNNKDNDNYGIYVRRKVVGIVREGLGTTGSHQQQQPENKDKDKDRDKDKEKVNRPSPPAPLFSEGA